MAPAAKTIKLNDGRQIPWIGFGTGTALYGQDATALVTQAIENGLTHLDGAQMYRNEDTLGAAIKASGKPRSELFITTKLDAPRLAPGQTVKDSLQESLKKLQLEFVDLFLIHCPYPANEKGELQDLWRQMEETQAAGLAKSIGVSNFRVQDLEDVLKIAKVVPAVNQIELHPYVWKAAKPIFDFDKTHGIVTASYGGLAPITHFSGGPVDATIASVRERLELTRGSPVTLGQVLTKWLCQIGAVVITTTSKTSRIKEFLDVENVPDLEVSEIQAIEDAGSKLHKRAYMHHVFGEKK